MRKRPTSFSLNSTPGRALERDVFVGADARQRVGNDDRLDQAHGRRDHRPHAELGDAPHALFVMAP